jgi:hypothetical protein
MMYRVSAVGAPEWTFDCNEGHDCVLFDKLTGATIDISISEILQDPSRYMYVSELVRDGGRRLVYSELVIEPLSEDYYHGFNLDKNNRFVLSNGTITKNSGKTFCAALYVFMMACKYPKSRGLIAANTYNQLHSATMIPILGYLREVGMKFTKNKRPPESWTKDLPFVVSDYEGVLTLENGAHIFLRSLDKPEALRGLELGWFLLDEIASSSRVAWDIIIGTLRDKWCDELFGRVVGSPDGFNWTAEEFDKRFSKDPAVGP